MMDEAKRDEVRGWLKKAVKDLRAAKLLADGQPPLLDVAVYHCQQAAEKALKGFLVAYDVRVAKTHNVQALIEQAEKIEPMIGTWEEAAARLTPFAFLYRYPGVDDEPDEETAREAIDDAETIVNQVVAFLPEIVTPDRSEEG